MSKGESNLLTTLPGEAVTVIDRVKMTPKFAESDYWAIEKLKLWDKNPRSIKDDRFNELKTRLKRQGQIKPLLITKQGIVIGGNMRLRAMTELGWDKVWVSVTEAVTDKEIFDLALTDNEEFGYYEKEQLAELAMALHLTPLELQSYELNLGKTTTLDLVLDEFQPTPEEDEVPEVDEVNEPESRLGEVYQLGRHRLMCGDATKVADVELLMSGSKADMVFTDPPYGIGEAAGKNKSRGKLAVPKDYGDDKWDDEIPDETAFINMMQYSDNQIIFGGNYFVEYLTNSPCWLVWDKNNGETDFADVELAWTSFNKAARLYKWTWQGMIREGQREDRLHPTQKPTGLLVKILKDYSTSGQSVLDLFGGSGSTLIACEQTNRICYMSELDPKYCDVIRKRYYKHTFGELDSKQDDWIANTPAITEVKELEYASR